MAARHQRHMQRAVTAAAATASSISSQVARSSQFGLRSFLGHCAPAARPSIAAPRAPAFARRRPPHFLLLMAFMASGPPLTAFSKLSSRLTRCMPHSTNPANTADTAITPPPAARGAGGADTEQRMQSAAWAWALCGLGRRRVAPRARRGEAPAALAAQPANRAPAVCPASASCVPTLSSPRQQMVLMVATCITPARRAVRSCSSTRTLHMQAGRGNS